jgi:hypothetical protein
MTDKDTKPADKTAALRQQRRRERLKNIEAKTVDVLLSKEQGKRLDRLVATGYAATQSAVLSKALDEAFERQGNVGFAQGIK